MSKIELTKAEEQVMQVLWKVEKGFVKDLIKRMPDPKPAYTTVSTIIRILVDKKAVSFKAYGKTHEYYPLISKEEYSKNKLKDMVQSYFDGSPKKMLSFLVKKEKMDLKEIEDIMKEIDND